MNKNKKIENTYIDNITTFTECKNEIKSFINLIHGDIKKGTYFSVVQFNQNKDKPIKTEFFDDVEKCMDILDYMNTDIHDTYFSVHEFNAKIRKSNNHFAYTSFFFDIDCHNDNNDTDVQEKTLKALHNAFEKTSLMLPTSIVSSGRGFHLYYVLDKRLPRKNLKWLYDNLSEYLANQIKEAIKDVDGAILDSIYKDSARVLRLPFTYNSNANINSSIIYLNKNRKFNIDYLRELAGIPAKKEKSILKENPIKKLNNNKILYFTKGIKLHNDRLQDIIKLIELRKNDCKGHREELLFLLSYYHSFSHINNLKDIINNINDKFIEKLSQSEVKKAIKSGIQGFKNWYDDKTKGYNYKNKTLINMLEITEEEQAQLKTIISKNEKYKRAKEKNWYNTKRDEERKEKKLSKKEKVIELIKKGFTYRNIIEMLQVSTRYITKMKKEIAPI